jgi:hypothetical protein
MKRSSFLCAFALAVLSLGASASAFGTHTYGVNMTGAEEVPPVPGTGFCGATVTLDDVTGAMTVSGSYTGMSSSVIAGHLHGPAAPGFNAGIIVSLTVTGGTAGTLSGSATLSPANIANMLNGLTYLNLHTTTNPGGEVRGQVVTMTPAMPWQWVVGLGALALAGGAFLLTRRTAVTA